MDQFLIFSFIVFCVTRISSSYAEETNVARNTPANPNQFPYMVSLQRLSEVHNQNRGHMCGGALVTLQHALTAASCLIVFDPDSKEYVPIDRDEYRVFAGSVTIADFGSPDQIRRIANVVAHPQYTVVWDVNDIGVIVLGTPYLINTVGLLTVRVVDPSETLHACSSMGWRSGTQLIHEPMIALSENTCNGLTMVLPNMLCARPENISARCPGDRGSPLVCDGLVGILSASDTCSLPPQMFTRVSRFTTWVDSVLALPIPELGPEPSTVAPPPTTPTTTTPAPGAASMFQPALTLLAAVAVAQFIIAR
ncbi:hypothetical protein PYW08_010215 [Mythimna loreyi]|uniref:Uncharacterized protein n=1 Tax=Mythimna loreyi TaxID=667449 RepID=A0ACC2QAS5_9NEOP|nr:hypothetical protein PYW08_010215 [Mythimna loreyi]